MTRTADTPAAPVAIETYARYLPELIIEKVVNGTASEQRASVEQFRCAVMFADISGFTALTERLAAQGAAGNERLTKTLNAYFTQLIIRVRDHGGDVVKFAGDALIAIWRERRGYDTLALSTWRACRCGLEIQQALKDYTADGAPLTLRVAIGAGPVAIAHVGGQLSRWEFIISGRPLEQVGIVSGHIQPGSVGVSPQGWKLLQAAGDAQPRGFALDGDNMALSAVAPLTRHREMPPTRLALDHIKAIRNYLPGAIIHRIDAGHDEFLGELRLLTILFVNLPDIKYSATLAEAQEAMVTLQRCCYRFEGSINKLSVDDKGVSLLAAYGLPPLSHEDDPDRGVKAGLAMHEALAGLKLRSSIGISTGRVYCGAVGSDFRREYTIMGDSVNLAARLMQNAAGGVLCDAATRDRASPEVTFDPPRRIRLKGKADAVEVFQALRIGQGVSRKAVAPLIVGRESERRRLRAQLDALLEQDSDSVVVLEADSGMGKSLVIQDFVEYARTLPIQIHEASGDAIEKSTSYFVWQQILGRHLGAGAGGAWDTVRERALHALDMSGHRSLAPLLNDILPLGFEDNELTAQMDGQVRAANTRGLVADLLCRGCPHAHHLLVIDDVHWIDSASWAVLLKVVRELRPLMVLLATRPVAEALPEYKQLRSTAGCEVVTLGALSPAEATALVCSRLDVQELPAVAARLINERAEGHPYFSEELGYALRDAKVLTVTDGRCEMAPGCENAVDLPHTIEGVITSRIDRLSVAQAMTIKVASVIGRSFRLDTLKGIYPTESRQARLREDLGVLERLELTHAEAADWEDGYAFKQIMTQQVAYGLMLHDQRRQLHDKVARWYERNHEDLLHHYALLAHHWERAGDYAKAMDYLELAADGALGVYANAEGAALLGQALALAETQPVGATRRGAWLRRLGRAQRDLAHLDEAQQTLERALQVLEAPMPPARAGLVAGILWEALKQLREAYWPTAPGKLSEEARRRLTEAAEACELAQIIYYWNGDRPRLTYAALRGANLATGTGCRPRVLTRIYGNLGVIAYLARMPRAANYYRTAAERQARADGHPPTLAWVLMLAATNRVGVGRWEEAERACAEGLVITDRIGDERLGAALVATRTLNLMMQGRFEPCLENYRDLWRAAVARDDRQITAWGLLGQARIHFRRGHYRRMADFARQAAEFLDHCPVGNQLDIHSQLAVADLIEDNLDGARRRLAKCTSLLHRPSQVTLYTTFPTLAFGALEANRRSPGDPQLQTAVKNILIFLKQFAKIFPVGEPGFLFFAGLDALDRGERKRALKYWARSLKIAGAREMSYETALVCQALQAIGETLSGIDLEARMNAARPRLGVESAGFPYRLR